MSALVEFDGVTKRYADGTRALHELRLSMPRAQFCVVLGPSGAGKSTLLRMLNGLARPDEGDIRFDGVTLTPARLRQQRSRIGSIHQHYGLVGRLSVLDNVLCGLLPRMSLLRSMLGVFSDEQRRRACRRLAEAGLDEGHLYRRADELSGGQQQRVGIARALMCDPQLILADEPVASLDPRISRDILGLLRSTVHTQGVAVLCTLHQVELALEFADRIVGLRAGRVVFDGTPAEFDAAAHAALYSASDLPVRADAANAQAQTPPLREWSHA